MQLYLVELAGQHASVLYHSYFFIIHSDIGMGEICKRRTPLFESFVMGVCSQ